MNENDTITIYHSIGGVHKEPIGLEIDEDYIGTIFQSRGVDYHDKEKSLVQKIWKELDGLKFETNPQWEDVSIMLDDDQTKYSRGYHKRLDDIEEFLNEEVQELIEKHNIEEWKYHTYEEYENDSRNIWYVNCY